MMRVLGESRHTKTLSSLYIGDVIPAECLLLLEPLHLFLLCSLPVNGANSSRDKENGRKKKRDIYMSRENLSPDPYMLRDRSARKKEGAREKLPPPSPSCSYFNHFSFFGIMGLLSSLFYLIVYSRRERGGRSPQLEEEREEEEEEKRFQIASASLPPTHPCPFRLIMKHLARLTFVARQ